MNCYTPKKHKFEMKGFLIFCISLLFFSACKSDGNTYQAPDFPQEKHLHGQILIPADSLLIQYPYGLYADDDNIYLLALAEGHWMQVYDRHSGRFVARGISFGQGPGEIQQGYSLSFDQERQTFDIYDEGLRQVLSYRYDPNAKTFAFVHAQSFPAYKGAVRKAWHLNGHTYLTEGQTGPMTEGKTRFQLYRDDHICARYDTFPLADDQTFPIFVLSASTSLSPDRTKLASATLHGGILETFQLDDSAIQPLSTRYFYPPHIRFEGGAIQPTPETVYGFSSLCADNECLYAVLIGGKDANQFNRIAVFDWEGREQMLYHTDCQVFAPAVCPSDANLLYAIAFSREAGFYLVSFDLSKAS